MSIEQKIEGSVGKLFLSDEIDLDKSPQVRENIKDLIDKVTTIEVQLSRVKYIDSSGIAALIEGMQLAKSNIKRVLFNRCEQRSNEGYSISSLRQIFYN